MFTQEDLIEIRGLIWYAMWDLWEEDEPLINVVYNKINDLIENK